MHDIIKTSLLGLTLALATACSAGGDDDPTLYLTGTEQLAVQLEDGTFVCESPKKILICHVPPGNPDNAHTICVGAAAERAHSENHGDLTGACEGDDGGDPGDPDGERDPDGVGDDGAGDDGAGDDGTGDDGAGDDGTGDDDTGDDGGSDGPVPTEPE